MAQLVDSVWQVVGTFAGYWLLGLLLAIVLGFWFGWFVPKSRYFAEAGAQTFDSRAGGFRPALAASILDSFTGDRLAVYDFQAKVIDNLFPIFYSLMAAVWIRKTGENLTELRWLILLPFAMAIFDWLENFFVRQTIKRYRANREDLGSAPTWLFAAQRIKWLLLGALVVVLLLLTIGAVRRAF